MPFFPILLWDHPLLQKFSCCPRTDSRWKVYLVLLKKHKRREYNSHSHWTELASSVQEPGTINKVGAAVIEKLHLWAKRPCVPKQPCKVEQLLVKNAITLPCRRWLSDLLFSRWTYVLVVFAGDTAIREGVNIRGKQLCSFGFSKFLLVQQDLAFLFPLLLRVRRPAEWQRGNCSPGGRNSRNYLEEIPAVSWFFIHIFTNLPSQVEIDVFSLSRVFTCPVSVAGQN